MSRSHSHPIRVFVVVSLPFSFSEEEPTRFWRFGPIPRASSEGFLATFTPGFRSRALEESIFDLEDSLVYSLCGVHFSRTPKCLYLLCYNCPGGGWENQDVGERAKRLKSPELELFPFSSSQTEPDSLQKRSGTSSKSGGSARKYQECDTAASYTGELRFGYVMTPGPKTESQGILVTLKPTDEALR